jgi:hypothetical protein
MIGITAPVGRDCVKRYALKGKARDESLGPFLITVGKKPLALRGWRVSHYRKTILAGHARAKIPRDPTPRFTELASQPYHPFPSLRRRLMRATVPSLLKAGESALEKPLVKRFLASRSWRVSFPPRNTIALASRRWRVSLCAAPSLHAAGESAYVLPPRFTRLASQPLQSPTSPIADSASHKCSRDKGFC